MNNAKVTWSPTFRGATIIPTPRAQVSPKVGNKMATHLKMVTKVFFSSEWLLSTPRRNIFTKTTIRMRKLIKMMMPAGMMKASRAYVSCQFSQQPLFSRMYPWLGAVDATVTTAMMRGAPYPRLKPMASIVDLDMLENTITVR